MAWTSADSMTKCLSVCLWSLVTSITLKIVVTTTLLVVVISLLESRSIHLPIKFKGLRKSFLSVITKEAENNRSHSPLYINFTSDKLSIINTYEQKTISLPFLYSQSRWCYNIEVTNHTDPHGSQGEFPYPEHQCIDLVRSAITLDCDFDQKTSNLRKNIRLLDYVSVCAFVHLCVCAFVCLISRLFVLSFVCCCCCWCWCCCCLLILVDGGDVFVIFLVPKEHVNCRSHTFADECRFKV